MKLPRLAYDAVHKFARDLAGDVRQPIRVASLAHVVFGAIHADAASTIAIGRAATCIREVSEKHSIKQANRMLANSKVDATAVMPHVIPTLVSGCSRIGVAVDRANTETRKRTHLLLRQGHEYMTGVVGAVIVDVRANVPYAVL